MPWRGPVRGSGLLEDQFPSLGWALADWLDEIFWWMPCTDEQVRKLVYCYRLDPVTGDRVERRAQFMGPKGCGKSPEAAKFAIAELEGEVVFDGWDAAGEPVGRPWDKPTPLIQIAAVSIDQTDNTYGALQELLTEQDGQAADILGLDCGDTRTVRRANHRARIDKVTASAGSREGQPVVFCVLDETHLWIRENGGWRLVRVVRRNVGKMGGWSLETTNAYVPAHQSVAQATDEAAAKNAPGIYQWKPQVRRVVSLTNKREVKAALRTVYRDAHWAPLDRLFAEMHDPDTTEAQARQFYLNEIVPDGDAAWDPDDWAARADVTKVVADREQIALGFDGSRFHDSTGLIGIRLEDRHVFVIDVWERPVDVPEDDWEVPGLEVDAAVKMAFGTWRVEMMFGDPPYWETYLDQWHGWKPKRVKRWYTNQTKQMVWAVRRFDDEIRNGGLTHDGNSVLAQHVANAHRRATNVRDDQGRFMWDIGKENPKSSRKIDACMAAIVADEAASAAIAAGALNRSNAAWFI